jgi:SSS family solute:Na+ symporter
VKTFVALLCLIGATVLADEPQVSKLPNLPDKHGFAGPFVGVHEGALIVAGGANFPAGVPWHKAAGGMRSLKIYHDRIFVLEPGASMWAEVKTRLPKPVAYGLSISTDSGILCIGGERRVHVSDGAGSMLTSRFKSSDVYMLIRLPQATVTGIQISNQYKQKPLPPLPSPLTAMTGGRVGDVVYVVGGATNDGATDNVWALDLAAQKLKWVQKASISGPRTHAVAVAPDRGKAKALYVFSGRRMEENGWNILTDAQKYSTEDDVWTDQRPIQLPGDPNPRSVMAGTGVSAGFSDILIFGGARGDVFIENEQTLARQIAQAESSGDSTTAEKLRRQKNDLYDFHNGFSRDILSFNTVTGAWAKRDELPGSTRPATGPHRGDQTVRVGSAVTSTAVWWEGGVVIPTGEVGPGVRTPAITFWKPKPLDVAFGLVNWLVLGGYLAALVVVGVLFSKRESTTEDFFLAGRRIPWWAAGLSIVGTTLSAITYLSMPATSYTGDWVKLILNCGVLAIAPLVVLIYLPFYRRLKVASAYEYLELRFDVWVRWIGSVSFILFQLGRMGIVVLLPALALSAVTGMDVYFCIVVMGVLSTIYTVLGGMEAVIWTDVLQVVVLVGGAIAALVIIGQNLDGGLGQVFELRAENKFRLFNIDAPWAGTGIGVLILGAIVTNALVPYTTDQAIIQRYLSTPDEKQAARAIWLSAIFAIPAGILFLFLGTALFAFFATHPAAIGSIEKADQVFPTFIAHQMPAGLAGLVIAGVFAAAMSSLDSSMHSICTVATIDFADRFRPNQSDAARLKLARILIIILGVVGTVTAMLMASLDIKNLWGLFLSILGLISGPLAGLFILGLFTTRVLAKHACMGAMVSFALLLGLWWTESLHGILFGVVGVTTCATVGYVLSWIVPAGEKPIEGLTIYTRPAATVE